jgi:hypothetical protein
MGDPFMGDSDIAKKIPVFISKCNSCGNNILICWKGSEVGIGLG